ncbi:MAG: hypothetical protein K1Y02_17985 [Candidatus Hydrogenedentes bacterium]|nr:hypothetical protein [Candidatus Hydrogenedentota bacterium]
MLWPLVLPAKITFWLLLVVLIVSTIAVQRYYKKGMRALTIGTGICILLFIPCCIGVQTIIDPYRFGVFTYPDFLSVKDFRVERYLPDTATNITIDKYPEGFCAKFSISKQNLDEFFERQWSERGKEAKNPRESPKPNDELEFVNRQIASLGWKAPDGSIGYRGPRASNGAGFTLMYNEPEGIAYELAGYW